MTIIPSFLITGILAILFGLVVLVWSAFFVHRKHGGLVLILLCIPLLLFGGGIFPPLIGVIAGALGTRIHKAAESRREAVSRADCCGFWPFCGRGR